MENHCREVTPTSRSQTSNYSGQAVSPRVPLSENPILLFTGEAIVPDRYEACTPSKAKVLFADASVFGNPTARNAGPVSATPTRKKTSSPAQLRNSNRKKPSPIGTKSKANVGASLAEKHIGSNTVELDQTVGSVQKNNPSSRANYVSRCPRSLFPSSAGSTTPGSCNIQAASHTEYFSLERDAEFWNDHNVQVLIRIRPLNAAERSANGPLTCVRQESPHSLSWLGQPETMFTFDHVCCSSTTQEEIFEVAGMPMVDNCINGYNSSIFAYGQTGSGKTHTMLGDIEEIENMPNPNRGVTPRIFEYLFSKISMEEEKHRKDHLGITCRCSFLEIYNEQITDLLDPSSTNLQIHEDPKKGIFVENLKEVEVKNTGDVMELLFQGTANRRVAQTRMNQESSRSHCVFTCVIKSKWTSNAGTRVRYGRLNLVDLAGSERQKSSGAEGERLREAVNINKSLSTLGLVIMTLVDVAHGKQRHVPYRDSKLTFLLQDSLGGNSKTAIIATVSPSIICASETLSTLKFAQRTKFIQNNAIINEDASDDVTKLRSQIENLKNELERLRSVSESTGYEQSSVDKDINVETHDFGSENEKALLHPTPETSLWIDKESVESLSAGAIQDEVIGKKYEIGSENQQLKCLIQEYEMETNHLKSIVQVKDEKIQSLECAAESLISNEGHLKEENMLLRQEINLLQQKQNQNPELLYFALENKRLMDELKSVQISHGREREIKLDNQLTNLLDEGNIALDQAIVEINDIQKCSSHEKMNEIKTGLKVGSHNLLTDAYNIAKDLEQQVRSLWDMVSNYNPDQSSVSRISDPFIWQDKVLQSEHKDSDKGSIHEYYADVEVPNSADADHSESVPDQLLAGNLMTSEGSMKEDLETLKQLLVVSEKKRLAEGELYRQAIVEMKRDQKKMKAKLGKLMSEVRDKEDTLVSVKREMQIALASFTESQMRRKKIGAELDCTMNCKNHVRLLEDELNDAHNTVTEMHKNLMLVESEMSKMFTVMETKLLDAESAWSTEKTNILLDLDRTKIDAAERVCKANESIKKFQDGQEVIKEAEQTMVALMVANETARKEKINRMQQWEKERQSLVSEISGLKQRLTQTFEESLLNEMCYKDLKEALQSTENRISFVLEKADTILNKLCDVRCTENELLGSIEFSTTKLEECCESSLKFIDEMFHRVTETLIENEVLVKELQQTQQLGDEMENENNSLKECITESLKKIESLESQLKDVLKQKEELEIRLQSVNEELETKKTFTDNFEQTAEKENEVNVLERSVKEFEITITTLECQIESLKRDAELQQLEKEDLEMEVQALRHQIGTEREECQSRFDDKKRQIILEAQKEVAAVSKDLSDKVAENKSLKLQIEELILAAEKQAELHSDKLSSLESMVYNLIVEKDEMKRSLTTKCTEKHIVKHSNSPFKCMSSALSRQINFEMDEELYSNRRRIQELEDIAASRQKEIFHLSKKLGEAESMTGDVIRDLLGVKHDFVNNRVSLDPQQIEEMSNALCHLQKESRAKEKELEALRKQYDQDKSSWSEDIGRRQGEVLAARLAFEKLRQKELMLKAENKRLKSDLSKQKKKLVQFEDNSKTKQQRDYEEDICHHQEGLTLER
uniref:Kinesin 12-Ie protein n=1 Tax=Marsilea vestita TaxID=59764 RepID=A0A142KWB9_MARVE|nr:kinesin 12-Ie protein [Marsilea vestita]